MHQAGRRQVFALEGWERERGTERDRERTHSGHTKDTQRTRTHTMADKFPEIDDAGISAAVDTNAPESDFLSREKEALGDEFKSENDENILKEAAGGVEDEDDDEEFEDFKSQFPEVGTTTTTTAAPAVEADTDVPIKQEDNASSTIADKFTNLNLDESEHIKEWKETRALEISKRDEIAQRKLEDIKKEAEKAIDDFYENYNNKKDDAIAETKKEEKEFLEKRDKFLENGTVWDRVVELLKLDKNSDAIDSDNLRDKSKFRDLLLALKGKEGVPGAAGV